ncbi:MAG: hypothetical protein KF837_14370 [Labilithrix sp.]|nr:hypothetical protein [Labilithrix sp.]
MNDNTKTGLTLSLALALSSIVWGCAAPTAEEEEMGSTESHVTADPGTADKITLIRSFRPGHGHWASVRQAPRYFTPEVRYTIRLHGQRALFACGFQRHNFLSLDPNCEGQVQQGFVGYADQNAQGTRQPLYRCNAGGDHFITTDPGCEGHVMEGLLGWVEDAAGIAPPPEPVDECQYDFECGGGMFCQYSHPRRCEAGA